MVLQHCWRIQYTTIIRLPIFYRLCSAFLCGTKKLTMQANINIVLLIDDATVVTSRLKTMLEEVNNSRVVLQAANYTEALDMMDRFQPDYVLIDIGLSDKTGMALLEEITDKHKGSKVVVITNLANPRYREFCEKMGVNHFLDKSDEFQLLPDIISGASLN